jgi:transcriptional regulatory protein LevR
MCLVMCEAIGYVRKFERAFVVFTHGSGTTLAMADVVEQLVEVNCALVCTT